MSSEKDFPEKAGWGVSDLEHVSVVHSLDREAGARLDPMTNTRDKGAPKSHIASGARLRGTFEFDTSIEIDCDLEGEINAVDALTIGPAGNINATIVGSLVKVFGRVQGDIHARDRLELRGNARVVGNISAPSVVIDDGVVFQGSCQMEPAAVSGLAPRPARVLESPESVQRPTQELTEAIASPSTAVEENLAEQVEVSAQENAGGEDLWEDDSRGSAAKTTGAQLQVPGIKR